MKKTALGGPKWFSWLVLIVGILYLLADYGVALTFWKVNWYTALFILW